MHSLRPSRAGSAAPARRLHDLVGNVHAGDVGAHPLGRLRRAQRADADQDEYPLEQAEVLDALHEGLAAAARRSRYCVCTNCAPAATFFASRSARHSSGCANGFSAAPSSTRGAKLILRPDRKRCSSRSVRAVSSNVMRVEVEYRQCLRMIARLHAVAGEAQQVAHSHGRAAENIALDGDAVPVAAGDLHHRRIADAGQQRTHREARHVAVGAAAVGGVDRVHMPVEDTRAPVNVFRDRPNPAAPARWSPRTDRHAAPARSAPGEVCPGSIGSG